MDRVVFLLYCATNAIVYVLVKYYHLLFTSYSALEVMSYMNINALILCIPYVLFRFKNVISGFGIHMKLSLSAPASLLKIFSIQFVSPQNAMAICFLMPITVSLLSFIILNEYDHKLLKRYTWLVVSLFGIVVFVGADFDSHPMIYALLLLHVFMRALVNIFLKKLSNDRYVALFYSIFYYAVFGAAIFLWYGRFDWRMIFSKEIFLFSFISIFCQFCLIKSYELAKKISLLQNLDYSRMIFSCIASYFILGDIIAMNQVFGICIITISIMLSHVSDIDKYNILTLGFKPRDIKAGYKKYKRRRSRAKKIALESYS